MRHYEIMLLVHPDQSEQVPNMITKYKNIIEENNGKIYKLEDLGKKQLAYQIKKLHKAHYILMNIKCNKDLINKLYSYFKFNDAVIRNIIIKLDVNEEKQQIENI